MPSLVQYGDAPPEVRAVFDDIKATRNVPDVNNFWKALARHPDTLRRTWDSLKQVMGPGTIDPLTKEMLYLAVSVTNGCRYCMASHERAARRHGMSEQMLGELLAIVAMACQTNRLAEAYDVPIDP
ncbi:MAG: carboxymuconolactone decarboxylase family protein [Acetobacteraceae bacterium]